MQTLTFPGSFDSLEKISDWVVGLAEAAGFDDNSVYAIQLAVDEACTNIIEHAYGGEGLGDIVISVEDTVVALTVTLQDRGIPFRPEDIPDPNLKVPLEDLEPRGVGLYFMRKMMNEVMFEFTPDQGNILTMKKYKRRPA